MKRNEAFPSKYISKDDVAIPIFATVASVRHETLKGEDGDEQKTVMTFAEDGVKPLIINTTNWMIIEDAYGEDSDEWIGRRIELYKEPNVMFGTKRVGGVRVRIPQNGAGKPAQPAQNGNGHKAAFATFQEAATYAGPFGITADAIKAEFNKRGFTGWKPERSNIIYEMVEAAMKPAEVEEPF